MKKIILPVLMPFCFFVAFTQSNTQSHTRSFDNGWFFRIDNKVNAAAANYDDTKWRKLDLPHDWSIEDLPNQKCRWFHGWWHRMVSQTFCYR
jgi:beta-galactosidase